MQPILMVSYPLMIAVTFQVGSLDLYGKQIYTIHDNDWRRYNYYIATITSADTQQRAICL